MSLAQGPLNSSMVASVTAGTFLLLGATYFFWTGQRRPNDPPFVKYLIPWLGSAIEIGQDADGFFRRAREQYGDIFGVQAAGLRTYYVTSMPDITAIYKNPRAFAFSPVRMKMSETGFGMSRAAIHSEGWGANYFALHQRMLASANIGPLLSSLFTQTLKIFHELESTMPEGATMSTTLDGWLRPAIFEAMAVTLFGPGFPAKKSFKPFEEFDKHLPLLVAELPKLAVRKAFKARDELTDLLEEFWKSPAAADASDLMKAVVTSGNKMTPPFSSRDRASLTSTEFWAAEGNMPWAFFWSLKLPLHEREGLGPMAREVDAAKTAWLKDHPSADLAKPDDLLEFLTTTAMPLVDATISEALRLSSSSFSMRIVQQDGASVGKYQFLKGDKLICATRSVHQDAEIYGDADVFRPERFLTGDAKETSAKKHMLAFGGGVSQCEGRHLAIRGCKILVALFLMRFDVRLDPAKPSKAEFDTRPVGMGILPSKAPTPVIVGRRTA